MIRPHKAPDSSCISRKLFLILRSACGSPGPGLPDDLVRREKSSTEKNVTSDFFRHRPPFFFHQALEERASARNNYTITPI